MNAAAFAAIPTVYQGVKFRSRTEARWAAFFDAINLPWQYERDGVRYLPDFWLPKVCNRGKFRGGCYLEIKPAVPTSVEQKKVLMLAAGTGRFVILAASSPITTADEDLHETVRTPDLDWDDEGLKFAGCDFCDRINVDFATNEPPCPCGVGHFSSQQARIVAARGNFQNFARWAA